MKYFLDTEFIEDGITIDLISIGIVAEDGREFYAVNKDCEFYLANEWVEKNVIPKVYGDIKNNPDIFMLSNDIRQKVLQFIGADIPEFWGWYAGYDWVVFCQLFGKMIDLPKGWPMFCRDIKQLCDNKGSPSLPIHDKATRHNALGDAKWNKQAYDFLMSIK